MNQEHAQLAKEQPEVQPLFLEAGKKNKLLRSVAGGGVEELTTLKTRWDKFEIMMESHQLMIKDQVKSGIFISWGALFRGQVKILGGYSEASVAESALFLQIKVMSSKVESEIHVFNIEMDKFSSRWHQLKPRDDVATGGDKEATASALASLKERRAEFNELVASANRLRCEGG